MSETPAGRLILAMGIPMMISMVLQAVYNIVDSAFVSNMAENGEAALNALTLAFPMQILMVAVSVGTGVGANVLAAKCLGMKDSRRADKAAGNAVFLAVLIYVVFLIFGICGAGAYIRSQTADGEIAQMGTDYLKICCIFSFGMSLFAVYEKLLQSTGNSLYSTIAQISGAVTNMILDPVLIYGKLGFPEMGVKGAAYATIAGQIVSFLLALLFHLKVNKAFHNNIADLRPSLKIIGEIYSTGLPAIISQALISVMTYGLNIIFGSISEAMVTAYGLFYKIQQFLLFAAFGMRDAIMPVTAYGYGMGDKGRIRECVKYGQLYTFAIMLAGSLIIELFAAPFSDIFGLSGETQELCISAMRIISVCFVFAGTNIAFQGIFQAMDGGFESLIISVCRQILFIFPVAAVFAAIARADSRMDWLAWITFPIAETATAVIGIFLFRRVMKKNEMSAA